MKEILTTTNSKLCNPDISVIYGYGDEIINEPKRYDSTHSKVSPNAKMLLGREQVNIGHITLIKLYTSNKYGIS